MMIRLIQTIQLSLLGMPFINVVEYCFLTFQLIGNECLPSFGTIVTIWARELVEGVFVGLSS